MKHAWFFFFLSLSTISSGQTNSADLEVWGLPEGLTKDTFVRQLNEKKLHVCMADIRPLGFKDANVIGMDNIYLVTLRPIPEYSFDRDKFGKYENAVSEIQNSKSADNSHSIEVQLALKNFFAEQYNDTAFINSNFRKAPPFDAGKYAKSFNSIRSGNMLSKDDCLAILYYAKIDSLKEEALVSYLSKIKTNEDVFAILPFVLDNNIDLFTGNILKNYFRYNQITKKEWQLHLNDIMMVLNSPNPTVTTILTTLLIDRQIPTNAKEIILKNGSITIKEILKGQHSDIDFYKLKIYTFIKYLTGKDFGTNSKAWLDYIEQL